MVAGATLAEVRASLQAKGYGTDTSVAQLEAVNTAYRSILSSRRWPFLEKTTTFTTAVGVRNVTLSTADAARVTSVRASTPAYTTNLQWLPAEDLRDRVQFDPVNGEPEFWTILNSDTLQLWPAPDQAYTLTVVYTSLPPNLTTDTDVLVIPRGHEDAVVWAAIVSMAFRQRDYYALNAAKQEAREALKSMIDAFGKAQGQSPRQVERWPGWDSVER